MLGSPCRHNGPIRCASQIKACRTSAPSRWAPKPGAWASKDGFPCSAAQARLHRDHPEGNTTMRANVGLSGLWLLATVCTGFGGIASAAADRPNVVYII